jgi:hypothetical protein
MYDRSFSVFLSVTAVIVLFEADLSGDLSTVAEGEGGSPKGEA